MTVTSFREDGALGVELHSTLKLALKTVKSICKKFRLDMKNLGDTVSLLRPNYYQKTP